MPGRIDERKPLRCSFCNKTQDQVRKLIAGPNVYICDECIDLCKEIIDEEDEMISGGDDSDIKLILRAFLLFMLRDIACEHEIYA